MVDEAKRLDRLQQEPEGDGGSRGGLRCGGVEGNGGARRGGEDEGAYALAERAAEGGAERGGEVGEGIGVVERGVGVDFG